MKMNSVEMPTQRRRDFFAYIFYTQSRIQQAAIYGCKNIISHARNHKTDESLDYIALWNASMLQQSEIVEAMAAKQMKRDGNYAPLPARKLVRD